MKKNRIFAIVALLAVIVSSVVVFQACKKDEVSKNTPITESTKLVPIAVKNLKTGVVKYEISALDIQNSVNYFEKNNDRYIVESIKIIENDDDHSKDGLQYTIMDTELESTSTTFMSYDFFNIEHSGDELSYFLDNDIVNGNFSYVDRSTDGDYLITVSNFCITNIEKLSSNDKAPRPRVKVTCEGRNCATGGCSLVVDAQGLPIGCSDCGKTPSENVYCVTHVEAIGGGSGNGGGFVTVLSVISSLITIVGFFL